MRQQNSLDMQTNATDYTTSLLKSVFGAIPIVGPAAQELLGIIIPNQRMDRVVRFVEALGKELEELKEDVDSLNEKLADEKYSSLFYKACVGSADAYLGSVPGTKNENDEVARLRMRHFQLFQRSN